MSFLRPEFLFALPLVAVPVLLHLLNRQRYQRVDFAAMEFLRRAMRRQRRRLFLEDFLLLLLRTLAVLLLVLALARPGSDPDSLFAGRPARGEVVVLDASLSMAHRSEGASSFERALAQGLRAMADLDSQRGDQAALVRAGVRAERLAFGEPADVRAALSELDLPGHGAAALAEAVGVATQTAASLAAEGCQRVRITVLSDLQATGWDLEGAEGQALAAAAQEGWELSVVDTGARSRENLAVTWLEVEPASVAPGEPAEVSARIRSFGGTFPREVRATLSLDGVPVASQSLEVEGDAEVTWTQLIRPAEQGRRAVEVHLDRDALAGDDARSRILPVKPATQVLLVGDPAPAREPDGVFEVLRRFLDLGELAPVQIEEASPGAVVADRLARTDVVVLADPSDLPTELISALQEHTARGGGLLLALGPQIGPEVDAFLEALDAPPLTVGDAVAAPLGSRVDIREPQHPALSLFLDPRWKPLLTEVPVLRYRPLALEPGGAGVGVPLRFVRSTGEEPAVDLGPALVEWRREAGRCAVLAATPLPGWNRMSEIPGGTLPFLFDLAGHLAPRPAHALSVDVGGNLEVELPRAPTEVRMSGPDGRVHHSLPAAVMLPGGRALQPLMDRVEEPGVWTVRARMIDLDGEEVEHVERIAVVPPVAESNLTPLGFETLEAALPPGALRSKDVDADESVESLAPPSDLSGLFYALVAAMLVLETLLAALLDRRRG